jgi:predicted DNA-binding transcriptional regulator AlpA
MRSLPPALNEKQLCQILGISPKTAQSWRHQGRGPTWYRLGKRLVRYDAADVLAWKERGRVEGRI